MTRQVSALRLKEFVKKPPIRVAVPKQRVETPTKMTYNATLTGSRKVLIERHLNDLLKSKHQVLQSF